MTNAKHIRCAIYTRKSSEEGLEQSFNSLQAQREACEAYIKSQKHEGWHALTTHYDDGGFSGGSMERPALQKLLDDIAAGKINAVVVYKVDRLTRSLMDFSKIIASFDAQNVSFVSVTQQFNTTSSMGRLTLNVLLSFAQFEREVTGERIRDKIAASKKKGMWMGGTVPLGYDVHNHLLTINQREADTVRTIFTQYLRLGCVSLLKKHLDEQGIVSKSRVSENGRTSGGVPFSRGALYQILGNEIYIGRIPHKTQSYSGQHDAIVPRELWDKVSSLLAANNRGQRSSGKKVIPSLLTGLLYDEHGNRYTPTHAVKDGKRYRYYTSQALIRKRGRPSGPGRIAAGEIEDAVVQRLLQFLASPEELVRALKNSGVQLDVATVVEAASEFATAWSELVAKTRENHLRSVTSRVVIHANEIEMEIELGKLLRVIAGSTGYAGEPSSNARRKPLALTAALPTRQNSPGFCHVSNAESSRLPAVSATIKAIARAHQWMELIVAGELYSKEQIAARSKFNPSYVSRILRFAALSPKIVCDVMEGRRTATSLYVTTKEPSLLWDRQN